MGYVLTPDIAYQVQALEVSQRSPGRQFDGYKAGLTAAGSAASFGLTDPVAGVLLEGTGLVPADDGVARVDLSDYNRAMIEVEIGFVLSAEIKDASLSLEELRQRVARVIPVVELPDLGFQGGKPDGVDVIAANVAARYYVAGAGDLSAGNLVNELSVALYHDDVLILNGQASDAMGDQWRALHWLVSQTLATGWPLQAGHILITGALGKMLPLEAGEYTAEYGDGESIRLRVQ
jgi:2-keto-4-pentenoate hydratase